MSETSGDQIPNQQQVERKFAMAQFHLRQFREFADTRSTEARIAAEACACATIDQLLAALTATLHGFNLLLPDPLPPLRVNRKNLRDLFHAIQGDSQALRAIEDAARVNQGWLWWLEQKAAGNPFFSLLADEAAPGEAGLRIWRNPLNRTAGFEASTADTYLAVSTEQMQALIRVVAGLIPADVIHYREAARTQLRRLL